jgi:hypothetical protein
MGFLNWIKLNPSAITAGVVALVNFLIAYNVNISQDQAAAYATIAGAIVTIVGIATARPVNIAHVVAAVTTIAGALAAFHFTLTAAQISTGATVLTLVLGAIFHFAGTPVSAWKKDTDATTLAKSAALAR